MCFFFSPHLLLFLHHHLLISHHAFVSLYMLTVLLYSSKKSTTITYTHTHISFYRSSSFMSVACVFCKIIKGEIPCHKIAETSKCLAFLDVAPLSRGHVLVIPKAHCARLHELDEDSAADLGALMVKLSRVAAGPDGNTQYNILQNNGEMAHQVVQHVHFHIIPKRDTETGLKIQWDSLPTDHTLFAEDAKVGKAAFDNLK